MTTQASWPSYGGDLGNTRHVDYAQISGTNVGSLDLAWKYETGVFGMFETSPIVVGRTMYITSGIDNSVVALDATDGHQLWKYTPQLVPSKIDLPVNRGVAYSDGLVFLATLDARLIALDASSGAVRWQRQVQPVAENYTETMAPLAWRHMVFVGATGGEFGIRGALSAYSAKTGKLLWRWWSVSPGWEGAYQPSVLGRSLHRDIAAERRNASRYRNSWVHGGGPIWMTPALDEPTHTIFAGVGNPWPDLDGATRPGDNLYTDCVVALDALTGRLRWYYQEVPHDVWDYDAAAPPILINAKTVSGQYVAAVGAAGKTGWLYVLDRQTGHPLRVSDPFLLQRNLFKPPSPVGVTVDPSGYGGAISPSAYDPATRTVFIVAATGPYFARSSDFGWHKVGQPHSVVAAVNVDNGKVVWTRAFAAKGSLHRSGGALSASGVVFVGDEDSGVFYALDERTGQTLWQYQTSAGGSGPRNLLESLANVAASIKHWLLREPQAQPPESHIHGSPTAYVVDGREFIAIGGDANYYMRGAPGDTLYVFSLP